MDLDVGTEPECGDETEAAYVAGLRDLLARHGVRFGEPMDLLSIAERVSADAALREAIGSRLRTIVRCEGEQVGRGLLMRMVVVAGGGPTVTPGQPELQEALWQIAGWVRTAFEEPENAVSGGSVTMSAALGGPLELAPVAGGEAMVVEVEVMAAAEVMASTEVMASAGEPFGAGAGTAVPAGRVPARRIWDWRSFGGVLRRRRGLGGVGDAGRRPRLRGKGVGWWVPGFAFLAAACVLVYLVWPASPRAAVVARSETAAASGVPPNGAVGAGGSVAARGSTAAGPRVCVGPMREGVSRSGIEERSHWAHTLLDQKLYAVALPQLRGLEAANPGFPGVALEESEALLAMGQLAGARGAADVQVRISTCLAGLPSAAVDAYCREEFSPGAVGECRPVMARVQAAAELQAARVHLELANGMHPDAGLAAALADLRKGEAESTSPAGGWAAAGAGAAYAAGSPGVDNGRIPLTDDSEPQGVRGRRRLERTSTP